MEQVDGYNWSEDDIYTLGCDLLDESELIQDRLKRDEAGDGLIQLSWNRNDNRYCALYHYDKHQYITVSFDIDFGSGHPWPVDIQDGNRHGYEYIGGHNRREEFSLGTDI